MNAGTDGRAIALRTNIFPVQMLHQYCLYQYHVDFNPPVPSIVIRKRLIEEKKEMFGGFYMFDGMQLYLQLRLEHDVSFSKAKFFVIVGMGYFTGFVPLKMAKKVKVG